MNKLIDKEKLKEKLLNEDIEVNIVDELMGKGKTSAAIKFINESSNDVHFLYITPYLTEVNRIIESCPDKHFKQPDRIKGTKVSGIKELFDKKENIVSTHSLFRYFDEEVVDLAYTNNYVLIMDEVADVIEQYYISNDDLKNILDNYAHVDPETKILIWDYDEYKGEFDKIKKLCKLNSLMVYNNVAMLWLFPITTFKAFRKTYILTYMFSSQTQAYYYSYYNVKYNRLYVKYENGKYEFTDNPVKSTSQYDFKKLINIIDNPKLNAVGDLDNSLSKMWYERNKNNSIMKTIKNNTYNYFKNIVKSPSPKNIWTTFKDYQKLVSGQGYSKGFVSSNMRATNEYMDRDCIAYLVNKFFNPYIKNFFKTNGVEVDEDGYAISEMLQFIWRSAIRRGQPINIYIPSKRMRYLLTTWIDNQKYVEEMNNTSIINNDEKLLFNGDFYVGFNSVLFKDKDNDNVSQIKCAKKVNSSKLETVTIEIDYTDVPEDIKIDLKLFENIKYIRQFNITYSKITPNLYLVETLNDYKDLVPSTYNGKMIGDIQKRLMNMTKQNKIVK